MGWEDFENLTLAIASEFSRKFRRYGVETADVAQELRLWLFQHPRKLAEFEALDDEKATTKMVARVLRNEAGDFCQRTKAEVLGYELHDLSWYRRGELKPLLDAMFDREAWTEPPVSEDGGKRGGDPAVGGNWLATLVDVARAFDQLNDDDKALLRLFHDDGKTNVDLAKQRGITPQAMSEKHHRVLGRLLNLLGGERPRGTHENDCECQYVGTRRVMSNAAARAAIENDYQEA